MCENICNTQIKTLATYVWKEMKYFEQTLATCLWNTCNICNICKHPPIYFCNIKMKQSQHTSKTSETCANTPLIFFFGGVSRAGWDGGVGLPEWSAEWVARRPDGDAMMKHLRFDNLLTEFSYLNFTTVVLLGAWLKGIPVFLSSLNSVKILEVLTSADGREHSSIHIWHYYSRLLTQI